MKARSTSTLALLLLATLLTGCGVTASSRNPGYVHFDASAYDGLTRDTSISIGPSVLRIAAAGVDEDPAAKELLRNLDGVRVQVFRLEASADLERIARDFERGTDFSDEQWQRIVRVVDDETRAFVFLKHSDEAILGLAILAVDDTELVFVNVMGEMNTEALAAPSHAIPERHASAVRHAALN